MFRKLSKFLFLILIYITFGNIDKKINYLLSNNNKLETNNFIY
jgi:hypothetical protein